MRPLISVLCVSHGRPDLLLECVESCAVQNYRNKEILVILNPGEPETESAIRERFPETRILRTHRNLGFFPALNLAVANSNGEYLMVVDDDATFIEDNALSRLVSLFADEPRLGAVTCNLEGPHETPIQGGDRYIRAFTTGFTMFPRKAVTDWVGYFPDLFFRSAGETFLCSRLWEQRRPIKRVEGVRMLHALAMKGRSKRDWYFYGLRSQILCAVIREPAMWLVPVVGSKFFKSFVQFIKLASPLVWLHAWASSVFHLPEALELRAPVSHKTRRLLARLDREPVHNLGTLPEWQAIVAGDTISSRVLPD